jgi:uncharacterized DUF497 family protein
MDYIRKKFEILPDEYVWFSFEWHDTKSDKNKAKHELSFEEAVDMFASHYSGTIQSKAKPQRDENGDIVEERHQILMLDSTGKPWRLVFVVRERDLNGYSEHLIRIISCHRQIENDNGE